MRAAIVAAAVLASAVSAQAQDRGSSDGLQGFVEVPKGKSAILIVANPEAANAGVSIFDKNRDDSAFLDQVYAQNKGVVWQYWVAPGSMSIAAQKGTVSYDLKPGEYLIISVVGASAAPTTIKAAAAAAGSSALGLIKASASANASTVEVASPKTLDPETRTLYVNTEPPWQNPFAPPPSKDSDPPKLPPK